MFIQKRNQRPGVGAGKLLVVLLALLLMPSLAQALLYNFSSQVSGPLAGQMTGRFEISNDAINDGTTGTMGSSTGLLHLELTFGGKLYQAENDSLAPLYPLVQLRTWDVAYMDYGVLDLDRRIFFTLSENSFTYYYPFAELNFNPKDSVYSSAVTYEKDVPVPEPATMVLFGIGLAGMGRYIRRKP